MAMTKAEILARIAEIDGMFEEAGGWGSWMSEASDERKGLVNRLRAEHGVEAPHKYEKRCA
jgi:hypothetical protein